jgi:hypothetical protein
LGRRIINCRGNTVSRRHKLICLRKNWFAEIWSATETGCFRALRVPMHSEQNHSIQRRNIST